MGHAFDQKKKFFPTKETQSTNTKTFIEEEKQRENISQCHCLLLIVYTLDVSLFGIEISQTHFILTSCFHQDA